MVAREAPGTGAPESTYACRIMSMTQCLPRRVYPGDRHQNEELISLPGSLTDVAQSLQKRGATVAVPTEIGGTRKKPWAGKLGRGGGPRSTRLVNSKSPCAFKELRNQGGAGLIQCVFTTTHCLNSCHHTSKGNSRLACVQLALQEQQDVLGCG